ncbi:MAG: MFS transporter [Candidatus Atabeyarchaeum deiterrae]
MSKEKPAKTKEVKIPGRGRTQAVINTANIIDNSDGQLFPSLYAQIGTDVGLNPLQLGTITGIRSFLQAATTPMWGWWNDKHSRKRVLAFGCFFWSIFTILTAISVTYVDMLIWRSITGIGLAVIIPTTSSLIADYIAPEKRGKAYGWLGLTGVLGAVVGTVYATAIGDSVIMGITGWRFVFLTWGALSIIIGVTILAVAKDPLRGEMEPELMKVLTAQKAEKYKVKRSDFKKILSNKTFDIILLQGVAGSLPWNGIFFMITWFEYIGFDSLTAGLIFALVAIGAAVGNLFGGWIGDRAAKWRPRSGRIIAAQISVFSGIPLTYVIFLLIPAVTDSILLFVIFGALTGLLISWCGPQNSTIFSDIFEPEIRGTVFSVDRVFEGSVAALGTVFVGAASLLFGFIQPPLGMTVPEFRAANPAAAVANTAALGQAMFLVAVIPWILCLIFYTLAYKTYAVDAEKMRKKLEQRGRELEKMK